MNHKPAKLFQRIQDDFIRIMMANNQISTDEAAHIFIQITNRYSKPNRQYHNVLHLIELYELGDEIQWAFEDPDAVRMAIIFHDAVYDAFKYDPAYKNMSNEESSARLAEEQLRQAGHDDEFVQRVASLIRMTEEHELTKEDDPDAAFFLDMDMAILGSDETRYREYAIGVAKEFLVTRKTSGELAFTPEQYQAGRTQFLENFTQKNRLFITDYFEQTRGEQARTNALYEMENLPHIMAWAQNITTISGIYRLPAQGRTLS